MEAVNPSLQPPSISTPPPPFPWSSSDQQLTLISLPTEVRLIIWSLCHTRYGGISPFISIVLQSTSHRKDVMSQRNNPGALLLVNKLIREETIPIFFGNNTFLLGNTARSTTVISRRTNAPYHNASIGPNIQGFRKFIQHVPSINLAMITSIHIRAQLTELLNNRDPAEIRSIMQDEDLDQKYLQLAEIGCKDLVFLAWEIKRRFHSLQFVNLQILCDYIPGGQRLEEGSKSFVAVKMALNLMLRCDSVRKVSVRCAEWMGMKKLVAHVVGEIRDDDIAAKVKLYDSDGEDGSAWDSEEEEEEDEWSTELQL